MNSVAKLPDNLPDLIELAVRDARLCAKDPRYRLDMGAWHIPNGKCSVCMAGAVMAKTLRVPRRERAIPASVRGQGVKRKLFAINLVRAGDCEGAARNTGDNIKPRSIIAADRLIAGNYSRRLNRAPWRIYLAAARILREGARVEKQESGKCQ